MGHAHAFLAARAHQPIGATEFELFGRFEACSLPDIHFRADPATGLRAIIAIHGARMGPARGGYRCTTCDSFADAVLDAMAGQHFRGSQPPG